MTAIAAAGAAELHAALNRFVTQNGLPGAAAGVVAGDELAWAAGAGFADTGAQVTSALGELEGVAVSSSSPAAHRRPRHARAIIPGLRRPPAYGLEALRSDLDRFKPT